MGNGGATQPVLVYVIGTSIGPPKGGHTGRRRRRRPILVVLFLQHDHYYI